MAETRGAFVRAALRATAPVAGGYVPLGMAFGVLFSQLDFHWLFAPLMGVVVFAGAAQFLAVGLLAAGAGLAEIAIATFLLNARHLFYGLSLTARFARAPWLQRLYLIFGLTDETYSLLTSSDEVRRRDDPAFECLVTGLNQLWWVSGCALGAGLGLGLEQNLQGLEFALVALFVVLTIEQARQPGSGRSFAVSMASAAAVAVTLGADRLLVGGLLLATAVLTLDWKRTQWRHRRST